MSLITALAIYFIIWWVVLFVVLPWGVHSQEESGTIEPGTDPGAPVLARLGMKLLGTTVAAGVVFWLCALVYHFRLVSIEGLAALLGR